MQRKIPLHSNVIRVYMGNHFWEKQKHLAVLKLSRKLATMTRKFNSENYNL